MSNHLENFIRNKIVLLKDICKDIHPSIEGNLKYLLERLENPFLITVFGEVKAGKSSFINALLKIPDLCRTDVDICTDRIYLLKYCSKEGKRKIDELTEEICINNPLLKGITIVDTPGINSVLEHHTYITENFLPKSDAILLILEADNPHTKPIWDWVKLISKKFGKKLVFILQKSDRLTSEQLERIIKRVKDYARESGVENPVIFPVSALRELQDEKGSGFDKLRNYLRENFTGEAQRKLKLEGIRKELINLYEECLKRVNNLIVEAENLKSNLEETLNLIKKKKKEADSYKKLLEDSVDSYIKRLSKEILFQVEEISIIDLTFRKGRVKKLISQIEENLKGSLKRFIENELIPKIELFEEGFLKGAVEEFSKRREEFKSFLKKVGKGKIDRQRLTGLAHRFTGTAENIKLPSTEGVIAFVGTSLTAGILLTLLSSSFIVDITGGVISALGLLIGSTYLLRSKRQLERKIEEILYKELGEKLKREISNLLEERLMKTLGVMESYLNDRLKILDNQLEELKKIKNLLEKNLVELKKVEID